MIQENYILCNSAYGERQQPGFWEDFLPEALHLVLILFCTATSQTQQTKVVLLLLVLGTSIPFSLIWWSLEKPY